MNAAGILGSMCFPSMPGFCGELFGKQDDKQLAKRLIDDGYLGSLGGESDGTRPTHARRRGGHNPGTTLQPLHDPSPSSPRGTMRRTVYSARGLT